jgi:hypothetical protein
MGRSVVSVVCKSNHDVFSMCSFIKPCIQGCAALRTIHSYLCLFGIKFQLAPQQHVDWDSTVGIATCHRMCFPRTETCRGNSFHTHPDQPNMLPIQWVPGLSQGVKQTRRGVDHPPPSSANVQQRVELCIYSPSGPSWPVLGWTLHLPLPQQYSFYPCEHHPSCLNNKCSHLDATGSHASTLIWVTDNSVTGGKTTIRNSDTDWGKKNALCVYTTSATQPVQVAKEISV